MSTRPTARLYAILARKARTAVIFRRGPSKQVLAIKWNLDDDTFEKGQWFKGRIYERRCDISPDGEHLIYFASKGRADTWTAVSKVPYLTAVLLWLRYGSWDGGGLFDSNQRILVNHPTDKMELSKEHEAFRKRNKISVLRIERGRIGEDDAILRERLEREGWTKFQSGRLDPKIMRTKPAPWPMEPPGYAEKARKGGYVLRMIIHSCFSGSSSKAKDQPGSLGIDHEVVNAKGEIINRYPNSDWADWDRNGDLLFSNGPKLYRIRDLKVPFKDIEPIADFLEDKFRPLPTPEWAKKW